MPVAGGFGAVVVDAARRRVYAAHGGDLVVIDADTRVMLATIPAGLPRSVAVDPLSGNVFVGTADGTIVELEPKHGTIVQSVHVDGSVDQLGYDAALGRLYGGGAGGTRLWVIDRRSFTALATIALPGRAPATFALDPQTHDVYANAGDRGEFAVLDPVSETIRTTISTPAVPGNGPLVYDPALGQIVSAGDGVLAVYDRAGVLHAQIAVAPGITTCDLDPATHVLACATPDRVTLVQLARNRAPAVLETDPVEAGRRTIATDAKTHARWIMSTRAADGTDLVEVVQIPPAGGSPTAPNFAQSP